MKKSGWDLMAVSDAGTTGRGGVILLPAPLSVTIASYVVSGLGSVAQHNYDRFGIDVFTGTGLNLFDISAISRELCSHA
jgi:hypothetical protein